MNPEDTSAEQQLRSLRTQLPTLSTTRDAATAVVTRTAADNGVDLLPAHARCLALAVADQAEQTGMLRGAQWAYDVVAQQTSDTQRHLINPAARKAATDPQYTPVLRAHEDYLAGMTTVQHQLRRCLLTLATQYLDNRLGRAPSPPGVPGGGDRATTPVGAA